VSSLSDWPIAYRRISFAYDEAARRLQVRGELMPRGDKPTETYVDLLAAWEKEACAASGVSIEEMRAEDAALVRLPRESRGSLLEWLVELLAPVCETCDIPLYRHAQAYQDELLEVILEVDADLGREAHQLHTLTLPTWYWRQNFTVCVKALLSERADTLAGQVELFRRKAALVALFNDHLDDLTSQRACLHDLPGRAGGQSRFRRDAGGQQQRSRRGEASGGAVLPHRRQRGNGLMRWALWSSR
jgi:hypothetical protein